MPIDKSDVQEDKPKRPTVRAATMAWGLLTLLIVFAATAYGAGFFAHIIVVLFDSGWDAVNA
jgi:hypothetical protein